jgi:plastocyanin
MRRGRVVIGGVAAMVALGGCGGSDHANVIAGKQLFTDHCSSCHTLARANATGVVGPNLDYAFSQSRKDGLGESTFQGIVHQWILHPNISAQIDPNTGKPLGKMPAGLVTGQDAVNIAAYVAQAAGVPGKDEGKLATVGAQKAEGTAKASNGTLDIPVAAAGTAFKYADAEASAGSVKITSKNPQTTDHNIAIDGNGVDQKGEVVNNGGTSTVTVDLKPGTYSFYCSVDGHRQAGMEGKLTVK